MMVLRSVVEREFRMLLTYRPLRVLTAANTHVRSRVSGELIYVFL